MAVNDDEIIILRDETGCETRFELLDTVEYLGESYVVLLAEDDDTQVVILKYTQDDASDGAIYSGIDDAEIIDEVFEIFKQRYKDEISFD